MSESFFKIIVYSDDDCHDSEDVDYGAYENGKRGGGAECDEIIETKRFNRKILVMMFVIVIRMMMMMTVGMSVVYLRKIKVIIAMININ